MYDGAWCLMLEFRAFYSMCNIYNNMHSKRIYFTLSICVHKLIRSHSNNVYEPYIIHHTYYKANNITAEKGKSPECIYAYRSSHTHTKMPTTNEKYMFL